MKKKYKSRPKGKDGVVITRPKDPVLVHGWRMNNKTSPYPTHTHGYVLKGWPEFFMDPLAFGAEGNSARIGAIQEYLYKNRHLLDAVLNGQIVKVTDRDLWPKEKHHSPEYTYCLREVSRDFEGAKMAYPPEEDRDYPEGVKLRIVQIWVDGDDFVIGDDYYRGGIRW